MVRLREEIPEEMERNEEIPCDGRRRKRSRIRWMRSDGRHEEED